MNNRIVKAVLYFDTPYGGLSKHVTWSFYEKRASLESSTSAQEAFENFLKYGSTIIDASEIDFTWIKTIWFYEETKGLDFEKNKKDNPTTTIYIGKNKELSFI